MNMGLEMNFRVEATNMELGISFAEGCALACMVNSEIGAVLAVVRRNIRWGGDYVIEDEQLEHSLIQSLKALRKQIFSWNRQWHAVDPSIYLKPFLDVIQSDEIGAPITGVALSSIYKILTFGVLDSTTVNGKDALCLVVDAVTSCRFEVTDSASEEVVLMKILQVLLACMKSKVSFLLNNHHVCTIINTCFRIVHQAGTKGELLQRIARHTMHDLVKCVFSHLKDIPSTEQTSINEGDPSNNNKPTMSVLERETNSSSEVKHSDSVNSSPSTSISMGLAGNLGYESMVNVHQSEESATDKEPVTDEPYGVDCMVEVLQFLCSLLNIAEHIGIPNRPNSTEFDEDVPLFALGLINSAIELGGPMIDRHPKLLTLIQDELFRNLMQFGMSMSPLILSMVCNIILNLYLYLRRELKLQLEAFFSCVILRLAQSKHGGSFYQQQEVLMEALVDFCRLKTSMADMYANFDCDITCSNVFEDLGNLLSKSTFPVNSPLSSMHILSLEGLVAVMQGIAERAGNSIPNMEPELLDIKNYTPFWTEKCEGYADPSCWVGFVRMKKQIKKILMMGADHFNRDSQKGLEFLQRKHLLPDVLDPPSLACFFRYTLGLDKTVIGDFLGNHDEFWVKVLHEFAQTFDFQGMSLDAALRLFLETFRLPGESQKIQRVLEAFSERYYEECPQVLANKDAALLLSYSIILLNTDLHNTKVKKKMTEADFIRNNRHINGGDDLPREFLLDIYNSICKNEIRITPEQGAGFAEMTASHWINLMHRSQSAAPFIACDSRPFLDHDMFAIISEPTLAAISVVYDHADHEEVYKLCIDGFLAVAQLSACPEFMEVLDDLVVSLCKFTTLLDPSRMDEGILAYVDDTKAMMATLSVFTIANKYGDYIRVGWKNIINCIIGLRKLRLLPDSLINNSGDNKSSLDPVDGNDVAKNASISHALARTVSVQKSYGLMGRFSQFLSLDAEESSAEPSPEEVAALQRAHQTIQKCQIDNIFTDSVFLQSDSLLLLVQTLITVSGPPKKGKNSSFEDEDTAVFCLELLITVTLFNRDRISLLWPGVYEHMAGIVQSTILPCSLVEKAVFGLLHISQRLLPYKEELADELLRSLRVILKLDARVADAYCEHITQEVADLVKANAMCIKSQAGWRTITSLLSITARHPEASEVGFEALVYIMSDAAHLSPANYILCVDAAMQFAESPVGSAERSIHALKLMAGSFPCIARWELPPQESTDLWMRLLLGLTKVCSNQREEVRNFAVLSLQNCTLGVEGLSPPLTSWVQCFTLVIYTVLDDLLEIAQGQRSREYLNMEGTMAHALKLMCRLFLQLLGDLSTMVNFSKLWFGVLTRMENYSKVKIRRKKCDKLRDLALELLKEILLAMKTRGVLVKPSISAGGNGNEMWESTWLHVNNISSALKSELFPDQEPDLAHPLKEILNSEHPDSGAVHPQ
ncbi:hypothetical protein Syun_018098 [Stephania yunnanensis]|uniref:SEC7 domain-containing protein n=1 Tax=Stephania yunnanensis TaxID=152371 RepID=A0AAP0ITW4_9MAGN